MRWNASRCTRRPLRIFALVDATNEFIAASEPWALAKDPPAPTR